MSKKYRQSVNQRNLDEHEAHADTREIQQDLCSAGYVADAEIPA
jgi:hypothetical protein